MEDVKLCPHSCNLSWLSIYVVVFSLSPLLSLFSFLYSVNEALAVGQAPWEVLGTPGNAKTPFCPPREEAELDEGC